MAIAIYGLELMLSALVMSLSNTKVNRSPGLANETIEQLLHLRFISLPIVSS